jgi:hypothetical protein
MYEYSKHCANPRRVDYRPDEEVTLFQSDGARMRGAVSALSVVSKGRRRADAASAIGE